ncbi:MAG TPA: hypothetical protein VFA47_08740 [Candidatus Manganitrophaceae bacterium]|nr:hypothetical protein [Candidatus Manganitrophaceae bacterium]
MAQQTLGPSNFSDPGKRGRGRFPWPPTVLLIALLFGCRGENNPTLPSLPADVVNISKDATTSIAPAAAASGDRIYVAWVDQGNAQNFDIFVSRSTDGGTVFDPPLNISQSSDSSLNPRVALSGSALYIVWEEFISEKNESDILFRKGEDQGGTWVWTPPLAEPGKNLSPSAAPCKDDSKPATPAPCPSQFPDIAADGDRVFVAWAEENHYIIAPIAPGQTATDFKILNSDIEMAVSSDGGASFTAPLNVSGPKTGAICGVGRTETASLNPALAAANGQLYLSWEDCIKPNAKILFRKFSQLGVAPPSQEAVSISDPVKNASKPALSAEGDQVYAAWEEFFISEPAPDQFCSTTDVLFITSAQQGNDFSAAGGPAAVNLSNTPCGFNAGSAKLAASGPFAYAAWQDNIPNRVGLSLRRSGDRGATFGARENLSQTSGSAGNPALAAFNGLLNAFWEDSTLGNLEILFARR